MRSRENLTADLVAGITVAIVGDRSTFSITTGIWEAG
jgi:hypothetical protein